MRFKLLPVMQAQHLELSQELRVALSNVDLRLEVMLQQLQASAGRGSAVDCLMWSKGAYASTDPLLLIVKVAGWPPAAHAASRAAARTAEPQMLPGLALPVGPRSGAVRLHKVAQEHLQGCGAAARWHHTACMSQRKADCAYDPAWESASQAACRAPAGILTCRKLCRPMVPPTAALVALQSGY